MRSEPCCEACAVELASGAPSRWPFAIVFAAAGITMSVLGARLIPSVDVPAMVAGVLSVVIAIVIGLSSPATNANPSLHIVEREPDVEPSPELLAASGNPYRARIAGVARRVVPLSGRSTAMLLAAAFVLSAAVLPVGLKLPRWVEAELVLAVWWAMIAGLLATLLFKGWRIAQDHRFKGISGGEWNVPEAGAGCGEVGGCGEALVVVAVIALAAFAAWIVVEIVVPIFFFAVYYFVVKAIGRVARDRHGCRGNLARSLGWGALWATLYLVPVAALVWGVHFLSQLKAGG